MDSQVFPQINDVRGAHFLNRKLNYFLERELESADEQETLITEKDWDNLIILDACRYDTYYEIVDDDKEDYIISPGSHSREFIEETFSEGDFSDIIYITANPHFSESWFEESASRDIEETFFAVYKTFETDWNEKLGTTLPDPVIRDALNAEKLYPEKKKIIHFMQPHAPLAYSKKESADLSGFEGDREEEAERRYRKNLEFVLDRLDELVEEVEDKTVITADHGELLGEGDRYFSHPHSIDSKVLKKVPWHIVKED